MNTPDCDNNPYIEKPVVDDRKDVRIGRLEKKVRKLIKQRDHWKEQNDKKDDILKYYPYAQKEREDWKQREANRKELECLRKRVHEQELAIEFLNKKLNG